MKRTIQRLPLIALMVLVVACRREDGGDRTGAAIEKTPSLVLLITVDQLRGDLPSRLVNRDGGIARLYRDGVVYTDAHYRHAATFTSAGHATIVTGANPREHGIVGNNWHDRRTNLAIYSAADLAHELHGGVPNSVGVSPHRLMCETIGSVLAREGGRVYAVGGKDRSATMTAGPDGKAFWYDPFTLGFITSTFHYPSAPPPWLAAFNERQNLAAHAGSTWTLLEDPASYVGVDDRNFEVGYGSLRRTFPHTIVEVPPVTLGKTLSHTPIVDEATVALAEVILDEIDLGRSDAIDMLSVGLSSTDYVGHAFGPDSLEAEDNLRRVDDLIARLLDVVDMRVGLDRTLVILTADHGIGAPPEYVHEQICTAEISQRATTVDGRFVLGPVEDGRSPCCAAGRLFPNQMGVLANRALQAQLGVTQNLLEAFWNPCIYVDELLIAALGLDLARVERIVADTIAPMPGVLRVVTRTELLAGDIGDDPLSEMIERSFHPERSGHVYIVQDRDWALYHLPIVDASVHGSPHDYDTHVAMMMMAPGAPPRRVERRVGPEDIAPTIAAVLDMPAPSAATGAVLDEVSAR